MQEKKYISKVGNMINKPKKIGKLAYLTWCMQKIIKKLIIIQ